MVAVATGTRENGAITASNLATAGAGLTGVLWLDKDHTDAFLDGFIPDKILKLSKRPGLVDIPLLLPNLCSLPDVLQVLHNQNIGRSTSFNYSFADDMIEIADYSTLLPRKPSQEPFGSLGAFGLKRSTQARKMPPYMHGFFAGESESIRSSSEVVDTEVDTNWISAFGARNRLRQSNIDIETSLPFGLTINQGCRCRFLSREKMPLVVAQNEGNFDSPLHSREGDHFFGGDITEYPLVVCYRSGLELLYFAKLSLRCLCDSSDSPHRKVGSKMIPLFKGIVAKVLELNLVGCFVLFGYLQGIVAGICEVLKCRPKSLVLLRSSIQLARYCFNKFTHSMNYITFRKAVKKGGSTNSSPRLKSGASLVQFCEANYGNPGSKTALAFQLCSQSSLTSLISLIRLWVT